MSRDSRGAFGEDARMQIADSQVLRLRLNVPHEESSRETLGESRSFRI